MHEFLYLTAVILDRMRFQKRRDRTAITREAVIVSRRLYRIELHQLVGQLAVVGGAEGVVGGIAGGFGYHVGGPEVAGFFVQAEDVMAVGGAVGNEAVGVGGLGFAQ